MRSLYTESFHPMANHLIEASSGDGPVRRSEGEENFSTQRLLPNFVDIADDGVAHERDQGVRLSSSAFDTRYRQQALLPINIFKPECCNFRRSKTINGKQHRYGFVADIASQVGLHARDQAVHIRPGWTQRQILLGKDSWAMDIWSDPRRAPPLSSCIPEKGSQHCRHVFYRYATVAVGSVMAQESIDVVEADCRELATPTAIPEEELFQIAALH